ncbi:hypothetical protein GW17_00019504 [Ensete ventricosum]|nr:hypothetical protein GW17_00019504 [Ensete ventricosum]
MRTPKYFAAFFPFVLPPLRVPLAISSPGRYHVDYSRRQREELRIWNKGGREKPTVTHLQLPSSLSIALASLALAPLPFDQAFGTLTPDLQRPWEAIGRPSPRITAVGSSDHTPIKKRACLSSSRWTVIIEGEWMDAIETARPSEVNGRPGCA